MNENQKWILAGVFLFLVFIVGIFVGKELFGRENISDNGDRAQSITRELNTASEEQRIIDEGMQSSENRAESILRESKEGSESIERAIGRPEAIEGIIKQSDDLDKSDQRLLREIQARKPVETTKD